MQNMCTRQELFSPSNRDSESKCDGDSDDQIFYGRARRANQLPRQDNAVCKHGHKLATTHLVNGETRFREK